MTTSSTTLDIVIVNWNAGPRLRECLDSVAHSNREGYTLSHVIVVDNASSDGSSTVGPISLPLTVIENHENRGFAAACNQGAMQSDADYLLFLNPDTRLFPETLSRSVAFMNQQGHSSIGILGVQLVNEAGTVSRTCSRFLAARHFFNRMLGLNAVLPSFFPDHLCSDWDHLESRVVDHVIGAYYFIRNSAFKRLKGFDERFFVYLEDVDLSLRAKRAGWDSYFLTDVRCFHKGGGTSEQIKARRLYYSLRSRILYSFKNFRLVPAIGVLVGTLFIEPVSRVAQACMRFSGRTAWETVQAYRLLWRAIPRIIKTARQRAA